MGTVPFSSDNRPIKIVLEWPRGIVAHSRDLAESAKKQQHSINIRRYPESQKVPNLSTSASVELFAISPDSAADHLPWVAAIFRSDVDILKLSNVKFASPVYMTVSLPPAMSEGVRGRSTVARLTFPHYYEDASTLPLLTLAHSGMAAPLTPAQMSVTSWLQTSAIQSVLALEKVTLPWCQSHKVWS